MFVDNIHGIHYADLKPHVNPYVQQLMQIMWDVELHQRDLYFLKANVAPPAKYKHKKRAK